MQDTEYQDISRELLLKIDLNRTVTDISLNCHAILGYQKPEIIGRNIDNYIVGDVELGNEGFRNFELTLQNKEGNQICFDAKLYSDNDCGLKLSLININKYKEIAVWENRFRTMIENTKDIVYLYNIIPEAKFVYINKAVESSLGNSPETAYADAMYPFTIAHPDELSVQYEKITKTTDFSKPLQSRMKNANGEYIWFEDNVIPFYNSKGDLEAISGFCRNIQDRKYLEEKLEKLSYHDSLTGLFSNNYYHIHEKRLNELTNSPIGIIMCDLDNLKMVNDTLGHAYGDKLLINFASILKTEFENHTVLIRKGGDEFVILIENTTEDDVIEIYYGVQQSMDNYNESNPLLPLKASIGWAYSPTSLGIIETIFKRADAMMYENKLKAKNQAE